MKNKNFEADFHINVLGVASDTGECLIGLAPPLETYQPYDGAVSIIVPMGYPTPEDIHLVQIHAKPDFFVDFPIGSVVLESIDMVIEWLDTVDSGRLN